MSWGLEDVSVTLGGHLALDSVTVVLDPGETVAVVGGDGAGKTSLARVLVGLLGVDAGEVRRPDHIGFQPATSGTWRDLTVLENLQFVAVANKLTSARAKQRIDRLLEATDLGAASDRRADQLSGGMRQKLGVAMALLPEPDLLVLDEPTTGVDPVSRLELWSFIASAAADNRAVLVTTAYVDEATRANHVLVLEEGRTLASGTASDVIASMPGRIFTSETTMGANSWRRGRSWRVWSPDGSHPTGAETVKPDLDDVITVAALSREAVT